MSKLNKIDHIKNLKNWLFEIDVCAYILNEFNGVDFSSFDDVEAKEFGKDFDKDLIKDLKHNINGYLIALKDYFKYLDKPKEVILSNIK